MTLGSLFDGVGGFPLAGRMNGIETLWTSEIEDYPMKISAKNFPNAKQLGDVTKIHGAEIEPVDIITFGSPCQDLSIAGKQLGIHEGQRSNLFFEAVRIIKEMRQADESRGRSGKSIRPRFAVWENVPNAFSCHKGADFQAVLEALARIADPSSNVPMPKKGKWQYNGCIVGDGYSIAWKVLDAQWMGVPQRRKRIYPVADFGSERTGEILFERESVSGHFAESGESREGIAADTERSTARSCKPCYSIEGHTIDRQSNQNGKGYAENYVTTLNATDRHGVVYEPKSLMDENWAESDVKNALRANASKSASCVVQQAYLDVVRTLTARYDSSPCVDSGQNVVCYDKISLNCTPSVVYDARGNGDGNIASTITGDHQNRVIDYTAICVGNGQLNQVDLGDKTGALNCMHDQQAIIYPVKSQRKYIVRRLTPLETTRLQGLPDNWFDGVKGSDSAIYKACGNGLAIPCAYAVMNRIANFIENEKGDTNHEED